jgi:hypothetical protein
VIEEAIALEPVKQVLCGVNAVMFGAVQIPARSRSFGLSSIIVPPDNCMNFSSKSDDFETIANIMAFRINSKVGKSPKRHK